MRSEVLPLVAWSRSVAPLLIAPTVHSAAAGPQPGAGTQKTDATIVRRLYEGYIAQRYQEPQRHYHTLSHITSMLNELDAFVAFSAQHHASSAAPAIPAAGPGAAALGVGKGAADIALYVSAATADLRSQLAALSTRQKVAAPSSALEFTEGAVLLLVMDLAVLFHDAVYDPTAKDNEARSVDLLYAFLCEARAGACPVCAPHETGAAEHARRPRGESPKALSSEDRLLMLGQQHCPHVGGLWALPELAVAVAKEVGAIIMATANHFSVPPLKRMTLPRKQKWAREQVSRGEEEVTACPDSNHPDTDGACSSTSSVSLCDGWYDPNQRVPTELLLLDLDLAILGAPPDVYSAYAGHIREEYRHFSDADFYKGRGQFLSAAVGGLGVGGAAKEPAQLFKTPFFFSRLEAQAWQNLFHELACVEAKRRSLGQEEGPVSAK